MFLGSRTRTVCRADKLAAIWSRLLSVGSITSHNPIGLHSLLWGWLYFILLRCIVRKCLSLTY
jgi:hypothetical protein